MRFQNPSLARRLACLCIAVALPAACTNDESGTIGDPDSNAPDEWNQGPPLAFDRSPVAEVPAQEHFVDGSTLYTLDFPFGIDDDGDTLLRVIDLEDGTEVSQAVPGHDGPFYGEEPNPRDSVFVRSGDEVLLLHAYSDLDSLNVRVFGAEDGLPRYTTAAPSELLTRSALTIQVDGGYMLVVESGYYLPEDDDQESYTSTSHVFDIASGELVWTGAESVATSIHDGVVGSEILTGDSSDEFRLTSIVDDTVVYQHQTDQRITSDHLGGGIVLLTEDDPHGADLHSDDPYSFSLVDTESASVFFEGEAAEWPECFYDRQAAVGCFTLDGETLTVIAVEDGERLWSSADLPASQQDIDEWLASYQGVFYFNTRSSQNPGFAVEASTGELLSDDILWNIDEVGPGYAISKTELQDAQVTVYAATDPETD